MLKESGPISKEATDSNSPDDVLVQIFWDDFRRQDDGSWVSTREITIDGPGGTDRLIKAGRVFRKGEMSIIGIDLAALLEKHLTHPPDLGQRRTWNFK